MEDSFDVVAVRVKRERGVVAAAVLGTNARRAVVRTAVGDGRCVPAVDTDGVRRRERDVCTRCDTVSTWLRSDRMQREVVVRTKSEQHVRIAFEFALPSTANPSSGSAASYIARLAASSLTLMPT